jgi:ferredoxin
MVDNTAVPVASEIEPDEDVLAAADSCPMEAIRVVDMHTGQVLAPQE